MEEVFKSGTLEMSTSPIEGLAADPRWSDLLVNRLLAVVAVALLILCLRSVFRLIPQLLYCYDRARGAESLEHSIGTARIRNLLALAFLLPFCLILDRFAVLRPAFWDAVPPVWSALATVGLLGGFVLVRALCHLILRPRRANREVAATLQHNLYNYLPLVLPLMLLTTAVLLFTGLDEGLGQNLLLGEIAVVWGFATLRSGQILGAHCAGFSTFLYLCGLEILPAALLVAVVVLF